VDSFRGKLGMEGVIKTISARAIGNRPQMWETTYDQLIKVNEANIIKEVMGSLRILLQKRVKDSKVLTKRRKGLMKNHLSHFNNVVANHSTKKRHHNGKDEEGIMSKKPTKANSV
jgi:hypothetical protein